MIIGIAGRAGSGKDTIADYLIKNKGFKKIALADPLKRLVKDVFVLDDHTVYDRVAREQSLEKWDGWTVRKLLQFIGTELFRENIDDEVWVKSLWYRIQEDKSSNYVVSDIRFPNELNFFRDNAKDGEFFCIKVVRDGFNGDVGRSKSSSIKRILYKMVGKDTRHASEKFDLESDVVIENNGSYEDLYRQVEEVFSKNKVSLYNNVDER